MWCKKLMSHVFTVIVTCLLSFYYIISSISQHQHFPRQFHFSRQISLVPACLIDADRLWAPIWQIRSLAYEMRPSPRREGQTLVLLFTFHLRSPRRSKSNVRELSLIKSLTTLIRSLWRVRINGDTRLNVEWCCDWWEGKKGVGGLLII